MGLYDDRLADLSEARHRVAARRRPFSGRGTSMGSSRVRTGIPVVNSAPGSSSVQSLLFDRNAWTPAKAKAWAASHGYKHGKVDVTDRYIRIRQLDPAGFKVKRTIPFGKGTSGIRAVIVREERQSMATVKASRRRRRRSSAKKKTAAKRPRRKRAQRRAGRRRRVKAAVAASRPRRRRRRAAKVTVRRRKRRVHAAVAEAPRRRRRRRRRASHVMAWRGDVEGHRKAAKKGHRRRKARRKPARRRRAARRRRVSEAVVAETPRRRRRKHRRRARAAVAAPRRRHRRHRRYMRASGGGGGRMSLTDLAIGVAFGGLGFVLADGVDRFLATYNPSATTAPPTDKFTSTGVGTLGNTLNVAARPNMYRLLAGGGMTAAPIVGAYMTRRSPKLRSAFEGMAVGTGIKFFSLLWSNVIMPLLTPKDTSVGSLQKSLIVRLYPSEVAAHLNLQANQTNMASAGSGALSGPPQMTSGLAAGVGTPVDVGPFAVGVSGDSSYPDSSQALRQAAGLSQQSYPTVQQMMGTGGPGGDFPTAQQALVRATGIVGENPYMPGPPPGSGPGPKATPHAECGCIGDDPTIGFAGILGDAPEEEPMFNMGNG